MLNDPYAQSQAQYMRQSQMANPYTDRPAPQQQAVQNIFRTPAPPPAPRFPSPTISPYHPPMDWSGPGRTSPIPQAAGQVASWMSGQAGGGKWQTTPPVVNPGGQLMPPQASPTALGHFANRLEGFNSGKLNDASHTSPKYQFARIASQFDPTQGITPDMLAQLNALGIGTFSGSRDKLHIDNPAAAFNGHTDFDVARDFGHGGWQWSPIGGGPAPDGGGGGAMDAGGLAHLLSGAVGNGAGAALGGGGYSSQILQYLMQQLAINRALQGGNAMQGGPSYPGGPQL